MDPAEMLRRGYTRETAIRRDARGRWFDGDTPLEHERLSKSFASWVDRAEDGRFCLRNDINWAYVEIEGPPYFVRSVRLDAGGIELRLSGERVEPLDLDSLFVDAEGTLWCRVREGRVPARFDSHAATQLSGIVDEDDEGLYLEVGGRKVRPPRITAPLAQP